MMKKELRYNTRSVITCNRHQGIEASVLINAGGRVFYGMYVCSLH